MHTFLYIQKRRYSLLDMAADLKKSMFDNNLSISNFQMFKNLKFCKESLLAVFSN